MVKSIKGREVNFEELQSQQGDTIALGNANMNGRGDLIGKGGKILKTREELAREYHTKAPNATKTVPLSDEINQMLAPAKPKVQTSKSVAETVKESTKESTKVKEDTNKK